METGNRIGDWSRENGDRKSAIKSIRHYNSGGSEVLEELRVSRKINPMDAKIRCSVGEFRNVIDVDA